MPRHDLPDGHEPDNNLIDFRTYLRRRVELSAQDNADPEPEAPEWEIYRRAEYGDGKRPAFNRYDLLWVALILPIAWVLWLLVFR